MKKFIRTRTWEVWHLATMFLVVLGIGCVVSHIGSSDGAVEQQNFPDYDAMRMHTAPQVEVPLAEALSLSAGLRWSHEEKSGAITYVRPRGQCSAIGETCPTSGERVAGENNGFADERSWSSFSPRLALSYDANADKDSWERTQAFFDQIFAD